MLYILVPQRHGDTESLVLLADREMSIAQSRQGGTYPSGGLRHASPQLQGLPACSCLPGEEPCAPTPDVNRGKGAEAEGHDVRVEAVNGEIHSPPRHGTLRSFRPLRVCVR
jgi:hypothetical protein